MDKAPEKAGFDLLGNSKYFNNASQFIQMWEEMAERGIQSETDLNNLKLSNLTRLGLLRQKQEDEVLAAVLKANKKLIDQRAELMRQAAEEEAELEKTKRIAALTEADETIRAERIAAIEADVDAETEAKKKQIDDLVAYEFAERKKELEKELKEAAKRKKKELQEENQKKVTAAFGKQAEGTTLGEDWAARKEAFKELFTGGKILSKDKDGNDVEKDAGKLAGFAYLASNLTSALSNFAKQLETQMDAIAGKKSAVDTRLYGSQSNGKRMGSYWDKMSADITGFAGVSPLVKQSAVAERVVAMVGQGIAFNVEQRATLDVIKEKIATTFDAANGTLLRLVRIQQQDTTAGRLGMEAALNEFLNSMYETTEYMSTLATSVKSNLEEAMSLMTGENALSFEYQIQKWLGSLSSVGMSDSAVQGLAGVLGQVAAGKIEGITNGGQGNLVIMAANQAGVNVSDILNNGLDQNTTNTLMNSMVDYLAKIYNDSGNSKVIQQQIASVYGLSASDLKAAVNLSRSNSVVARNGLDYSSAMGRLNSMANSMYSRTSIGEIMTNMWDNVKYSLASGTVNNPVTYALYKASGLLKDTTGGINFGIPMVMGNGMPITLNVADLMRTGALAGGAISSMAQMIAGMGGGGLTGAGILRGAGITNGISVVSRGSGSGLSTMGGMTVSESGSMVGNASSDDVTSKTMTDQTDSSKSETASAVDESDETKLSDVDSHVVTIIEILRGIADGNSILKVAIDGDVKIASESISQMSL
jgi:hypothetical protein